MEMVNAEVAQAPRRGAVEVVDPLGAVVVVPTEVVVVVVAFELPPESSRAMAHQTTSPITTTPTAAAIR
jgi:hypothetical protein